MMALNMFKRNEIILLLGAGASVEAGIPDSNAMVSEIERRVSDTDTTWSRFRDLYRYIRSAVYYADGLDGIFDHDVPFNIERLVNVLDELRKRERHTLYPFVGAWNPKLQELAGIEFTHVSEFRDEIIKILRNEWVALKNRDRASYYSGLLNFQQNYGYPLKVFSLNYDLCVEDVCELRNVQRGFSNRLWDWRLFDESSDDLLPLQLYKLHGSLDWFFQGDGNVSYSDSASTISIHDIALIFGTSYKFQYIDPFLFLAYELRRWTLDASRIIICVGYGFNDEHINGILQQALRQDQYRQILAVIEPGNDELRSRMKQKILESLRTRSDQSKVDPDQIKVEACGAKAFLDEIVTIDYLAQLSPAQIDLISELSEL